LAPAGLAIDALGFAFAAPLYRLIRVAAIKVGESQSNILLDLKEGWKEFASRAWVWSIVVQFTIINAAFSGIVMVLEPVIADASFGQLGHNHCGTKRWPDCGLVPCPALAPSARSVYRRYVGCTVRCPYLPAKPTGISAVAGCRLLSLASPLAFLVSRGLTRCKPISRPKNWPAFMPMMRSARLWRSLW
jgi:hypothetical protein